MKKSVIFAIFSFMVSVQAMSTQCGMIDGMSANQENLVMVSIDNSPWYGLVSQNQVLLVEKAYLFKLPVCYNITEEDDGIAVITDITIGKKAAPKS